MNRDLLDRMMRSLAVLAILALAAAPAAGLDFCCCDTHDVAPVETAGGCCGDKASKPATGSDCDCAHLERNAAPKLPDLVAPHTQNHEAPADTVALDRLPAVPPSPTLEPCPPLCRDLPVYLAVSALLL